MRKNDEEKIKELAGQLAFIDFLSECFDSVYSTRIERVRKEYEEKYEKALKRARRKDEKKRCS